MLGYPNHGLISQSCGFESLTNFFLFSKISRNIHPKKCQKSSNFFLLPTDKNLPQKKPLTSPFFLSDSITSSEKTLEQDILLIANYKPINTTTTICGFDVVKHETNFGYLDLISGQGNWVSHLWVGVERCDLSHRENDSTIFFPMK
jgi:hypothetical protein